MTAGSADDSVPSGPTDRKGAVRARILAAAVGLFGELGYHATTMGRVAAQAQVARATVFNHFTHKELLLAEVLHAHHISFVDLLRSHTDPTLPLPQRILQAQEQWSIAFARDVEAALPLVRAWVDAGGPLLPTSDSTADVLAEMIRAAQDAGSLSRTGSPTTVARAMNDVLTGAMVRWTTERAPTAESLCAAMGAAARLIRLE